MYRVECTGDFDFESDEYSRLVQRACISAFQRSLWLTAFYRHIVRSLELEPLIIRVRAARTGRLLAVVPLVRRRIGGLTVVESASGGVTDYVSPIIDSQAAELAGKDDTLHAALLRCLGPHDLLHIFPVQLADIKAWQELFCVRIHRLQFGRHDVAYKSEVRRFDFSNLTATRRKQMARKKRQLRDRGELRLRLMDGDGAADTLLWVRKHRHGRFENDPIQKTDILEFYQTIAAVGAASGFARTYQLSCAERPVAACFGIADGGRFLYLILGCDYRTFGRHSPGIIMLDQVMSEWESDGGVAFDFTIGDEHYKSYFHCNRRPMFGLAQARTDRGAALAKKLGLDQPIDPSHVPIT